VTLLVVLVSKFMDGAWITVVIVPGLVLVFLAVHAHYQEVGRQVASTEPLDTKDIEPPVVLLPVGGWSAITRKALRFAMKLSPQIYCLHVADSESTMDELEATWEQRVLDPAIQAGRLPPKLIVVFSPYRKLYSPLHQVIGDLQQAHPGRDIAVLVPELVPTRWWHYLLHNQTAAVIKAMLLFSGFRRVAVINVPWYLSE
jgi:hypothetical protein